MALTSTKKAPRCTAHRHVFADCSVERVGGAKENPGVRTEGGDFISSAGCTHCRVIKRVRHRHAQNGGGKVVDYLA